MNIFIQAVFEERPLSYLGKKSIKPIQNLFSLLLIVVNMQFKFQLTGQIIILMSVCRVKPGTRRFLKKQCYLVQILRKF